MSTEAAKELVAAVEVGRTMDKSQLRPPVKVDDVPELDAAVALLVAYVAELSAKEQIDRQLVATRDDIKNLVYGRPSRLDNGWRSRSPATRSDGCSAAKQLSASSTAVAASASRNDPSRTGVKVARVF